MTNPTIQPKKPRPGATDWEPRGTHGTAERWVSGGICVLSDVHWLADHGEPLHPEFHLSVSYNGGRAGRQAVRKVLRDFGMENASEDNHVPDGFVRNFWRHVNDAEHHVCPCQETEPAIETVIRGDDPDLFVWRVAP